MRVRIPRRRPAVCGTHCWVQSAGGANAPTWSASTKAQTRTSVRLTAANMMSAQRGAQVHAGVVYRDRNIAGTHMALPAPSLRCGVLLFQLQKVHFFFHFKRRSPPSEKQTGPATRRFQICAADRDRDARSCQPCSVPHHFFGRSLPLRTPRCVGLSCPACSKAACFAPSTRSHEPAQTFGCVHAHAHTHAGARMCMWQPGEYVRRFVPAGNALGAGSSTQRSPFKRRRDSGGEPLCMPLPMPMMMPCWVIYLCVRH